MQGMLEGNLVCPICGENALLYVCLTNSHLDAIPKRYMQ